MNPLEKFNSIDTLIFDVDGVMTDSRLRVQEDGTLLRTMNVRDGYALKRAVQAGLTVCIITGGRSEGVAIRLRNLGVQHIYHSIQDKLGAYQQFIEKYEIDEERTLYMGDDLPDFDVMRKVELPCCPRDAAHEIVEIAQYVSPYDGGDGCVRDVIEKILRLQDKWLSPTAARYERNWEDRINRTYFRTDDEN